MVLAIRKKMGLLKTCFYYIYRLCDGSNLATAMALGVLYEPIVGIDFLGIILMACLHLINAICWLVNYKIKHRKRLQVLLNPSWYDGNRKYWIILLILILPIIYYNPMKIPNFSEIYSYIMLIWNILQCIDFERINCENYNLVLLNNINWDIKLTVDDIYEAECFGISQLTNLKNHVENYLLIERVNEKYTNNFMVTIEQSYDQQFKGQLKNLEHDLDQVQQRLKDMMQEYKKVLEHRLKIRVDQKRSKQRLERITQRLEKMESETTNHDCNQDLKERVKQQFEKLEHESNMLKEILEKKSKHLQIRWIEHLSNDELEEFKNIFLDDINSKKV